MAGVVQYPHYLFEARAEESGRDANGAFVSGTVTKRFLSMCREERDGSAREYQVAGGRYEKASSLIQCPVGCPRVEAGSKVIVANDAECSDIRIEGICLQFMATQLHSRLWV